MTKKYIYVGRSNDIRRRLGEHRRRGSQKIDKYIRKQIDHNGGRYLKIKSVEDNEQEKQEENYLACMEERLGYKVQYNRRRGDHGKTTTRKRRMSSRSAKKRTTTMRKSTRTKRKKKVMTMTKKTRDELVFLWYLYMMHLA